LFFKSSSWSCSEFRRVEEPATLLLTALVKRHLSIFHLLGWAIGLCGGDGVKISLRRMAMIVHGLEAVGEGLAILVLVVSARQATVHSWEDIYSAEVLAGHHQLLATCSLPSTAISVGRLRIVEILSRKLAC
jgi:hypothetical protein